MRFYIDAWSALAPGMDSESSWHSWLENPDVTFSEDLNTPLKQIPPMLRRRFGVLGKCAVQASLSLLKDGESIPGIFSSRHGETSLTLSLLESIGNDEPVSPTAFSLAVHNAISGLFTIARKDTSEITSIAAMEYQVYQTICEAIGQLQQSRKLLCVIYDAPLTGFFSKFCESEPFPYAIAMIISQSGVEAFEMNQTRSTSVTTSITESESFSLLRLFTGITDNIVVGPVKAGWQLKRVK